MNKITDNLLVMLAQDGGTHTTSDGSTYRVTLVEEEKPQPTDYSHLVGKWVKALNSRTHWKMGKYYPVVKAEGFLVTIKDEVEEYEWRAYNQPVHSAFDLSNPLDHNPDFIPVPSDVRFAKYNDGSIGLIHGNNRGLYEANGEYVVIGTVIEPSPFHLEPCKFEDVKVGEFVYLGGTTEGIDKLNLYCLKTNNGLFYVQCDCIYREASVHDWKLCYRVVAD